MMQTLSYLINSEYFPRHRMRAEIAQRSIADVRIGIGRRGRLEIIIPGDLYQSIEIIIDILVHAIHLQLERIPQLQICAVIEQWLLNILSIGEPVLKNKDIRHQLAIDRFRELVIIAQPRGVLKIYHGIDILLVGEVRVPGESDGIQRYRQGHGRSGPVFLAFGDHQ